MDLKQQKNQINEAANYEGSIIIQAIVSNSLQWVVSAGSILFNQNDIRTRLEQVDIFPDLSYDKGEAKSTYVVYKSPSDLQVILENFDVWFTNYITSTQNLQEPLEPKQIDYKVTIKTNSVVYRGLTGNDTQSPQIIFKASTDFVTNFEGNKIDNWNSVIVEIESSFGKFKITNSGDLSISQITDSDGNMIVEQVLPSLMLSFHAKQSISPE